MVGEVDGRDPWDAVRVHGAEHQVAVGVEHGPGALGEIGVHAGRTRWSGWTHRSYVGRAVGASEAPVPNLGSNPPFGPVQMARTARSVAR